MADLSTSTDNHGAARISVVITVQNEAPGMERCLAGLDRQGTLLEVVVVDRGSIDHSVAAAARLGARVVEVGAISLAEARNIGLTRSSGDAVLFLDAKSIPCPGWARALAGPIIEGKTLATKGGFRTRQSGAAPRLAQLIHERRWSHREGTLTFLDDFCIGVHRQRFIEAGGFTVGAPDLAIEDQKTARMICDSGQALFVPQAVVERNYCESWSGSLRNAFESGANKSRLLRRDPVRCLNGARRALPELAQVPAVLASVVLLGMGLFAPGYLFLAALTGVVAPMFGELLLLKRGVDQFTPDFFFLGAALIVARAWAQTLGAVCGLVPRKQRAPQKAPRLFPAERRTQASRGRETQVTAVPLPGRPESSLLDPASVVQRKQTSAASAGSRPAADQQPRDRQYDHDDVVAEEDRELDLTP